MHKNSNNAIGNFGIYEIVVFGVTYKIGKADLDRLTLLSGSPTRIHQQIVKLRKKYGKGNVFFSIIETLIGVKTKEAKEMEHQFLWYYYKQNGIIPEGNKRSFKP